MGTSIDQKFIDKSESLITQFGFSDLKSFVKNHALLMILAKIDKYEAEDRRFEIKYGMHFENFRGKIETLKNIEVFAEEED